MSTLLASLRDDPAARVRVAATILCAAAVAGMEVEWLLRDRSVLRQLFGAASTCFLLVALAGDSRPPGPRRWMVLALGFCWLGDILGPAHFLTGVAMFFVAHLAFLGAFLTAGLSWARLRWTLGGAVLLGGIATALILPRVPAEQRPFLLAYSVVLMAMLGVAGGATRGGLRRLVPLAAGLFFVSDLCLAQTAFLRGGLAWTCLGYPMYYTACLLFAWSTTARTRVLPA